jgi:hypothetical protein
MHHTNLQTLLFTLPLSLLVPFVSRQRIYNRGTIISNHCEVLLSFLLQSQLRVSEFSQLKFRSEWRIREGRLVLSSEDLTDQVSAVQENSIWEWRVQWLSGSVWFSCELWIQLNHTLPLTELNWTVILRPTVSRPVCHWTVKVTWLCSLGMDSTENIVFSSSSFVACIFVLVDSAVA